MASREERIAALGYNYVDREKIDEPVCNLCGSFRYTVITHSDRYGFPATTVACHRCGLTRINPRMTGAEYAGFYADVYRPLVSAFHGRRIDAVTVQDDQKVYAGEMIRFAAPLLKERHGQSFLDVGGSTGVVSVAFAEAFGLKPTVLDPAPDEIREADTYGIETVTALLEDWDPRGRQFDIVGMFQTIDHLLDVRASLSKLRELIADDGLFIVDVVDFRHSYLKHNSVEMATKIDHPFSLTEETSDAYFARVGFDVVRKSYSADHHLVCYLCRPCDPDTEAMPPSTSVSAFFRELRAVQSTP